MRFKIGFRLMDLDELLDDPREMESNYADLLDGMYWLSDGLFWLDIDGNIIPSVHADWLASYPDDEYRHGSRHALIQFMIDFGRALQFINDSVPREIEDVICSGQWVEWMWNLNRLMESVELKGEFGSYKQDIDLAQAWWGERSVDIHYAVFSPVEISIFPIDALNLQIHWRVRERVINGIKFTGEQTGDALVSKYDFLSEIQNFRTELEGFLYARIDEVKYRGLEDVLVERQGDDKWFGADNIHNSLEEHLHAFDDALSGSHQRKTDWPATLEAIRRLEPLVGPLF